ncbi:hypothetical protein SEVIR_7G291100v4 [Setaria viridis]|uniref:Uncharacterized protein n=1 Tax=Setaria viridis TaxID=4556 RepID=A0A4U6TVP8_SETVI|nr:uncharacterized protein LOC117865096 [Setaria viridis]TKW07188.1 hypothetical protein SEVIR_7G291100v2 [Setaria viridis]
MAPAEMAATTAATSRLEAAGRMPSIEWEPKTLTLDQIKFAREAALYVVSTKTEEEAIRIFTEGLKPVQVAVSKSNSFDSSSDDDVELGCYDAKSRGGSKGGSRRRRSIDKDFATAPF